MNYYDAMAAVVLRGIVPDGWNGKTREVGLA